MYSGAKPATMGYYEFQHIPVRQSTLNQQYEMFKNDPESSFSQRLYGDGDRDLKDIMDTREYFDALGFIKFLTEIPL